MRKFTHPSMPEWRRQWGIFLVIFVVLVIGRATQVWDSRGLFLLSYTLVQDGSRNLKPYYDFPEFRPYLKHYWESGGGNFLRRNNINTPNETWTYEYPNTPAILSIPFVWTMHAIGFPMVEGHPPKFQRDREDWLQKLLASLLSAIYAVLIYRVARLFMEVPIAIITMIALVLGSSVASTVSRAVWPDTWAVLLITIALHHLAQVQFGGIKPEGKAGSNSATNKPKSYSVWLLIVCMALAFFCKATHALSVIPLLIWAFWLDHKKAVIIMLIMAMAGLAFIGYNLWNTARYLGVYHVAGMGDFHLSYFLGLMVSPNRGLLVYWPWLFFVIALVPYIYRWLLPIHRRLLLIAVIPVVGLTIILSQFNFWYGAQGYGARMYTMTLPWISLASIMVVGQFFQVIQGQPKPQHHQKKILLPTQKRLIALGMGCFLWSVWVNMYGVVQPKTTNAWYLNPLPNGTTIEDKMWDWRDPQFLAGIIRPERYVPLALSLPSQSSLPSHIKTVEDMRRLIYENYDRAKKTDGRLQ